jgi:hypothetical protein
MILALLRSHHTLSVVMRGLDPRIHVFLHLTKKQDVDARNKCGHDDLWLVCAR